MKHVSKEELAEFMAKWLRENTYTYYDEDIESFGVDAQFNLIEFADAVLKEMA